MEMLKKFSLNEQGRDIAVGDVHGHFSKLKEALGRINFNPNVDRLFFVGDLVDKGPESDEASDWLGYPWSHAVRGNHDDYVVRYTTVQTENWIRNGGAWFQGLNDIEQSRFAREFAKLPFAIQVQTPAGLVGLVHAECPVDDWTLLEEGLARKTVRNQAMWSKDRYEAENTSIVKGVRAVVCGHQPVRERRILGNTHFIDTAGWREDGYFTLLDLTSLTTI